MDTAKIVMSKWTKVIQYVKKGLEETKNVFNKQQLHIHQRHPLWGRTALLISEKFCTCGHPYPLFVSWRSCQCACGRCGLWVSPPCPSHKAVSLGQKASWQEQQCAAHAAVREHSRPPAARAPLVVQEFLLWLYATLAPEVWNKRETYVFIR